MGMGRDRKQGAKAGRCKRNGTSSRGGQHRDSPAQDASVQRVVAQVDRVQRQFTTVVVKPTTTTFLQAL